MRAFPPLRLFRNYRRRLVSAASRTIRLVQPLEPHWREELRAWLEPVTGPIQAIDSRPGVHGRHSVLALGTESGAYWLKLHAGSHTWSREAEALRRWASCLHPHAPRLLATHAVQHALLMTACPGEPLAGRSQVTGAQELSAHDAAGRWLARMHALDGTRPDDDPISPRRAIELRLEETLTRVGDLLKPAQHLACERLVRASLEAFEGVRRTPCHRDFMPYNWLVDLPPERLADGVPHALASTPGSTVPPTARCRGAQVTRAPVAAAPFPTMADADPLRLAAIDFEHARSDAPILDLAPLALEVWPARPDLRAAFLAGYGHPLEAREEQQLRAGCLLRALRSWLWAHQHARPALAECARTRCEAWLARCE